jgi:hypothetical protein
VREFFRTFRFSRFLHVSFFKSSTFRFAGFTLTRLAGVENIVFCCNRSTADHIITSPLFVDPEYERTHPDYTGYTQRFANKPVVSEAVERVNKRKGRKNK